MGKRRGFSMVELMIVMAIMLVLLSIAVPIFKNSIVRANETVLRNNLMSMRTVIDSFTYDKERPPQSLQELVDEGYLRAVPVDPITDSSDTWQIITDTGPSGESGIFDVKSGSDGTSLDGSSYADW